MARTTETERDRELGGQYAVASDHVDRPEENADAFTERFGAFGPRRDGIDRLSERLDRRPDVSPADIRADIAALAHLGWGGHG